VNCLLCDGAMAGAPGYLCPGDTAATLERLKAMAGLYVALGAFLAPGRRGSDHGGSTARVDAPLPVCEPVLDLRGPGGMVSILEDWRSALHEALGWSQPVPRGAFEERVRRAAKGLGDNVLWIGSSWPAAGDFAREIRDLHRDVTSIVAPSDRGRRLGNCPTIDESGAVCGAVLRLGEGESAATCRWCGASWAPELWPALRLAQQAAFSPASVAAAGVGPSRV
jgi:hypothetical protein